MRSREKILDATLEVIARGGFDAVSIVAVSRTAGVTRQTIYSIFGTREALVTQAMEGLAVSVLSEIEGRLGGASSAREYVVNMIVAGRRAVRDHPVLATLVQMDASNPVLHSDVMAQAQPVVRGLLEPLVDLDPAMGPVLDDVVHITVRLGMSVVLFDDARLAHDDDLRAFLTRWLPPDMTGGSLTKP